MGKGSRAKPDKPLDEQAGHVRACAWGCVCTYMSMYVHVCASVYMCVCALCIFICVYICVYMYFFVCVCMKLNKLISPYAFVGNS